jgi:hypothetical protein
MQWFRFIFFFFTATVATGSVTDLEAKIIHAVRETDCLEKFDYSGDLSTSNNENHCETGGRNLNLDPHSCQLIV